MNFFSLNTYCNCKSNKSCTIRLDCTALWRVCYIFVISTRVKRKKWIELLPTFFEFVGNLANHLIDFGSTGIQIGVYFFPLPYRVSSIHENKGWQPPAHSGGASAIRFCTESQHGTAANGSVRKNILHMYTKTILLLNPRFQCDKVFFCLQTKPFHLRFSCKSEQSQALGSCKESFHPEPQESKFFHR